MPLALLLVVVLSISGASFLQHDYLERQMAMNEVGNHGAFYLAAAGVERARETLKTGFMPTGAPSWRNVLSGTDPRYPHDPAPDPELCPSPPLGYGCAELPFQLAAYNGTVRGGLADGDPVTAADMPVTSMSGSRTAFAFYTVRAFNNDAGEDDPSRDDDDGKLYVRAKGRILNEEKLIELQIKAATTGGLIDCDQAIHATSADCPHKHGAGTIAILPSAGREPTSAPSSTMPFLSPPLGDASNFYRNPANFVTMTACVGCPLPAGTTLTSLQPNTHYLINGNATVQNVGTVDNVVIYSTGILSVNTGTTLTNATVVGEQGVDLNGVVSISARLTPYLYPAVISGGTTHGDNSVTIVGNVYSLGDIDLHATSVTGKIIGNGGEVLLRGDTTVTDQNNSAFYGFMRGFEYPDGGKKTVPVSGSWKEIR